jgi:hypothetical protein
MGMTPRIEPLDALIAEELGKASAMLGKTPGAKPKDIAAGDVLFREIVFASAIEARRVETEGLDAKHESAAPKADAQESNP